MKIDDLHYEDMKEFLYKFEEMHPEAVQTLLRNQPPVNVRLGVEWLHSVCCLSAHPPCRFYDEEELASTWQLTTHNYWLEAYEEIRRNLNIDAAEFINLTNIFRSLQEYIEQRTTVFSKEFKGFLHYILEINYDALSPSPQKVAGPAALSAFLGESTVTE